jgi:hypothetical protein
MTETRNLRAIWGSGYHAGLKAAEETNMQALRLETNLRNQTPEAQKVYKCVPLNKPWTATDIRKEWMRTMPPVDLKIIAGCLYSLKEMGLVEEHEKGEWTRVPLPTGADISVIHQVQKEDRTLTVREKPASNDPMALIADITNRMKGLIEELDDAAIAVTEMLKESERKSEQLTQLKALLKGIAD